MTDSLAELRAAIFENRDDDQIRLVYADRLMELGDPRGELISLQVKLASGLVAEADRFWTTSRVRSLAETFAGEVRAATGALDATYERGFLHAVDMRLPAFVEHGAALFADELVARVTLRIAHNTSDELIERAAAVPGIERVRELALSVDYWKHMEPFARLTDLDVLEVQSRATLATPFTLDTWPHRCLRMLILDCPVEGDAALLAMSKNLGSLEWLVLTSVTPDALARMLADLPQLRYLALRFEPSFVSLKSAGFRRAPSPRPVTRETRRITEVMEAHWELWQR